MWFRVGWSCCPPLCVLVCPLRQPSVCILLSWVLEHSSTLCDQLPGPALPGHSVYVDSLHISYADIFISQVRAAGGSPPQSQLPGEDVFWNATILHTTGMTQPSQSALSKQSVRSGKTSTRQYISVGYFILPAYSQDMADVYQVECVEPSHLPGICSSRLAAIQQCADNTGIVDCHICLHRQLGACPHSSCETGES